MTEQTVVWVLALGLAALAAAIVNAKRSEPEHKPVEIPIEDEQRRS